MKNILRFHCLLLVIVAALAMAPSAKADTVVFELDTFIPDDFSDQSGIKVNPNNPFLTATFKDSNTQLGAVLLTMDARNLIEQAFDVHWLFNVAPGFTGSLTFDYVTSSTGPAAHEITFAHDGVPLGQHGGSSIQAGAFDISFRWLTSQANRFKGGHVVEYLISAADTDGDPFLLTPAFFEFASINSVDHGEGGYYSAARLQGLAPPDGSGTVVAIGIGGDFAPVPEPSALVALCSLGLAGLLFSRRRRNRLS